MINESFVFLHSLWNQQVFAWMGTDLISEHFDIPYNDGDVDVQPFTIDRRESLDKWSRFRHATIHLNIADVSLCFIVGVNDND